MTVFLKVEGQASVKLQAMRTCAHFLPKNMVVAVRRALLAGCVFSLSAPAVWAQPLNDDQPLKKEPFMGLAEAEVADEVVVYGKAEAPLASHSYVGLLGDKDVMETPFSTVSYTSQYIEDIQAADITDVIAKTDPSVFFNGVPGESNESYSIRGLPSNVGDVTINGLAGMAAYYRNSPEMFERVEVLKGPSALLNGMPPKGSAGGTVNLVPKRAGDEPLTRITTGYVSNSQLGTHIDVGRRFGEDEAFGVRFNGMYRDGETAVETQDKRATLGSLALDWQGERARLSADFYRSEDVGHGLTRGLTLAPGLALPQVPDPDVSWNPAWAFYKSTDKGAMARGEFDLNENFTAYVAAGTSRTVFDSNMGGGRIINDAGDFRINFSGVSDTVDRTSAEVGLKGRLQTGIVGHQFALNATYYDEDYHLNGFRNLLANDWETNIYNPVWGPSPALPEVIPAIIQTKTRLTSVGFADTLSLAQDKLQLTLGMRHQKVESDTFSGANGSRLGARYNESATTPAAAILFKATDQISLYANYIEGLSKGTVAPHTAANAGETFAPYKTKQKEVGLKVELGGFSHTLSLYEIKRPSSYTNPTTNVFSFGGEQRNRGVEWGFFGAPRHNVRLMGGIAYSDPELTLTAGGINQGNQATGVPKWQAKLGAEWDVSDLQGLTLTANATSASKQYLDTENTLSVSGRTVFDLGARYVTTTSGMPLTLRAAVTNVTNEAYWAKPHFLSLAAGAPRTFRLSATLDF